MSGEKLICNHSGAVVDYEVLVGLNMAAVFQMQDDWSHARTSILRELVAQHGHALNDEGFARAVLIENNLADVGWEWDAKAYHCRSSEYMWFLLVAEGKAQGGVRYLPSERKSDGWKLYILH